jgi:RHS repeat-associated protein
MTISRRQWFFIQTNPVEAATLQQFAGTPQNPTGTPTIRYTYDTNSVDSTFSQYSQGRVTTVQYNVPAISSTYDNNNNQINFTGDTVIEMYSYTSPGQVAAKRLRVTRADSLNETLTADLNGSWTYNNEGKPTGVSYPGDPNGNPAPPTYTYSYDGMGRLAGMTETAPYNLPVLSGVTYNAAGQMTQMGSETRSYNVMGQLTNVHSGSMNITYNYSATQNNGKITSQVDNLTGEQVTYAYDSLQRLISAQAGSTWGQGFAYDPFGNLTDKTALAGSVPTMHIVPDPLTNHLGGEDANGNPPGSMDAENRLVIAGAQRYAYDAQNKRVWSCAATGSGPYPCTSQTYFFYGPDGKLLAQFTPVYTPWDQNNQGQTFPATLTFQASGGRSYFGGRLLGDEDRLGSRGKYFPYGDDRSNPPPANDQVKFATYTRDSATGLDYADQRYYSSTYGRFASPDQYMASAGPKNPQSWNRYSYTRGDPVNRFDPSGLDDCGTDSLAGLCVAADPAANSGIISGGGGSGCVVDGQATNCGVAQDLARSGAAMTISQFNQWWFTVSPPRDPTPTVQVNATYDAAHPQEYLTAFLEAIGLTNYLDMDQAQIDGDGLKLQLRDGLTQEEKDAFQAILNTYFTAGILGLEHFADVGGNVFNTTDRRTNVSDGFADRSLQLVWGPGGIYVDTDRASPYDGIGGFIRHAGDYVCGKLGYPECHR